MMYDVLKMQLSMSVPFARHAAVEIERIGKGTSVANLPFRPEGLNHIGTQHAAALFALGESASGAAMAGALVSVLSEVTPVAFEANIRFLALAKGPIRADALVAGNPDDLVRALKADGKLKCSVAVTLSGEDEVKVAELIVGWHVSMRQA